MLDYTLELHRTSTHPAVFPFDYEWEEIGPGYIFGSSFGHWDIVHQVYDGFIYDIDHAHKQLLNNIRNQEPNGLVPGSIWMPGGKSGRKKISWDKKDQGHPPVWVSAVDEYLTLSGNDSSLIDFFTALIRQITWFENERKAEGEGFFYNDILTKKWESGMDEGVRFDETASGKWACIDATSHVYSMYHHAEKWAVRLGVSSRFFAERKRDIRTFINDSLYCEDNGMFYDIWAIKDSSLRHVVFENLWPLIVGAIDKNIADNLIDNYILNPEHFLTNHPISTVSVSDPKFELRCWRGPSWNSMTYWVARACVEYGRADAAMVLLEKALDFSAEQFQKTGTIWEFYHPFGGNPEEVQRKPQNQAHNYPCPDYLGHNPLLAMAWLYSDIAL